MVEVFIAIVIGAFLLLTFIGWLIGMSSMINHALTDWEMRSFN